MPRKSAGAELSLDEQLTHFEKEVLSLREQLSALQRKIAKSSDSEPRKREYLQRVCELTPPDWYSKLLIDQASVNGVKLGRVSSFRLLMGIATRRRNLSGHKIEWYLNNKNAAQSYAARLGVDTPKKYYQDEPLDKIEFKPMSVIKPSRGKSAIGTYLVISEQDIRDVRTGARLTSYSALRNELNALLTSGRVKFNSWICEELIGEIRGGEVLPARDLKFYCFYGKVAMILEVERKDETKYCEWLPDGSLASTGRYATQSFIGQGVTKEQIEWVAAFSKEIPVPFMRIDFLVTENRFVLGEFTPRPGQFNNFSDEFDQYLGTHYLAAEARLSRRIAKQWR